MTEHKIENLESFIKSNTARKAIVHSIQQIQQFNSQYFPLKVNLMGLGGSSLRNEYPNDIDIIIETIEIKETIEEWKRFKTTLDDKGYEFYKGGYPLNSRSINTYPHQP